MITILYFIGDSCQSVIPPGDAYKRLYSCRDFAALIQQVSLPTIDKIPFISRLVHSYMVHNCFKNRDQKWATQIELGTSLI